MKILSASQLRELDSYTIRHEPIRSIDLMERAADVCFEWMISNELRPHSHRKAIVFCGTGNNGGDGLAIARMLSFSGYEASVYIISSQGKSLRNFLINEKRLLKSSQKVIHEIKSKKNLPPLRSNYLVIDALFGTGLSRPIEGLEAKVIDHINESNATVISIDLPSGLFADQHSSGHSIVQADHTLSFQVPKLAFFFPENERYVGQWHLLDINLNRKFLDELPSSKEYLTKDFIQSFLKPRTKFSHKGNYGHALLVAGSYGKMGAAVLAAKACLKSGIGLLTVSVRKQGVEIIQTSCPEAMVVVDVFDSEKYSSTGIGPGIGANGFAEGEVKRILQSVKSPLVIDADALNIISENKKKLLKLIPENSILTPHPKEFERLIGKSKNNFDRHEMQLTFSEKHKVYVILKGAHTCITTPERESFFNSTGNPGMAKGGSGDVLTGIITGLLAQGYSPLESSLLGVFMHGVAGDIAAKQKGMDAMIAGDIIEALPEAWISVRKM